MYRFVSILCMVLCICGCQKKTTTNLSSSFVSDNYEIRYAKGFQVKKDKDYTQIVLRNPWDTTSIFANYILVPKEKDIPTNLPQGILIRTPIENAVIVSATQASMLNELNSLEIVSGACEPHFIKQDYITKGVADGEIVNLGMASNPSTEAIVLLSPEVIFSDPVTGQNQSNIEKTKISIVQTPDYTESTPLGRAEWIRFYSLFLDKESLADSLFSITEKRYNEIKDQITPTSDRPSVFIDTRYQGRWNIPGGKSYLANLLEDAGANYLWADNESSSFVPLTFEAVLDKAGDGDKWLIRYYADNDMTYNDLMKEYKPYSYFKAFKEKQVYGCNNKYSSFFDDLPIHPDYILKDLAKVFYPNLFPEYDSKYFQPLKD